MRIATEFLSSCIKRFKEYKALGHKTLPIAEPSRLVAKASQTKTHQESEIQNSRFRNISFEAYCHSWTCGSHLIGRKKTVSLSTLN
jgi:hypothetical protein